ncbi:hypothetical protein CAPTEDRAFT_188925 [Capitella teleta]|uniref:C-type lectin domain-containing protein n=1 Tax=Capitella teleta TaxID=283909 RepID=R7U3W0_CAPTE|nr:hypothetical protein CAPTEDRAFT_188925 [Capitella teleta]|eukprot:ELU00816.1 hypothetical protein CAPTEDRAFT_188925 [Capitella teleta]
MNKQFEKLRQRIQQEQAQRLALANTIDQKIQALEPQDDAVTREISNIRSSLHNLQGLFNGLYQVMTFGADKCFRDTNSWSCYLLWREKNNCHRARAECKYHGSGLVAMETTTE